MKKRATLQTRRKISSSIKKVHATGRKTDGSKALYSKSSPVLSSLDGIGRSTVLSGSRQTPGTSVESSVKVEAFVGRALRGAVRRVKYWKDDRAGRSERNLERKAVKHADKAARHERDASFATEDAKRHREREAKYRSKLGAQRSKTSKTKK